MGSHGGCRCAPTPLAATVSGELGRGLCGLLSPEEIEAVAARARALADAGVLPEPGPRRSYTSPLV
jgi:hypothetical protein